MHNLSSNLQLVQALDPKAITSSALDSGNLDRQGAEALSVVLLVGDIADALDASHKITVKIEHADDDGAGSPGAYTGCTDADVLGYGGLSSGVYLVIDGAAKEKKSHVIDYVGGKRFVKVTATPSGLSTGGPVAMLALKGNLSQR